MIEATWKPNRPIAMIMSVVLLHATALQGCVTFKPVPPQDVGFMERAHTEENEGVSVTVVALGRKEAEQVMGVPLSSRGIQPVWVEIRNDTDDERFAFFQQSIDADYYAPSEVAYINHYSPLKRLLGWGVVGLLFPPLWLAIPFQLISAPVANRRMDSHIGDSGIGNVLIEPDSRHEGFVFTRLDEGTKHVEITLLSPERSRKFDMFVPVPGVRADHQTIEENIAEIRAAAREYDGPELHDALVDLPCCTSNEKASANGDPVNLVIIATFEDMLHNFKRAGWDETEAITVGTSLKTARSFMLGTSYRYSPVSNLYLFERPQDVAFQKARDTIHERNHLRLWLAPKLYRGKPVWVGQVSRDIGVRFTTRTWNLTTHAIDSDIDDSREATMGDLLQTGHVRLMGYVPGVGETDPDDPPENLTGDEYYTDGFRAVAELSPEPSEPLFFNWTRADLGPTAESTRATGADADR